jgi:AbrB family looped-hinge helix DNA binding protein
MSENEGTPRQVFRGTIGPGGRVVIPAKARKTMGLKPGDRVIMRVDGGELRMQSLEAAVRRAQSTVRKYVGADVDLAAELIAERRADAEHE